MCFKQVLKDSFQPKKKIRVRGTLKGIVCTKRHQSFLLGIFLCLMPLMSSYDTTYQWEPHMQERDEIPQRIVCL